MQTVFITINFDVNMKLLCIFKVIYLTLPALKFVLKYKTQELLSNGTVLRHKHRVIFNLEVKM